MKKKLTLSIDASLIESINQRAKLNSEINLSKMVENFLFEQFQQSKRSNDNVTKLRGVVKISAETENLTDDRYTRIREKHVK